MREEALRAFTSHLNGEIMQNPYNSSCSHSVKQCCGLPVNPRGDFSNFSDWWEVAMADRATAYSVKQTAMPGQTHCQNRRSRALGLLLPNPHWEKQNNLTHPKWLFTWPRCWMSTLFFQLQSEAACVGTSVSSVLLNEALLSAGIFLYITYTLCAVTGRYTHSMICPLVYSQKKNWQNKTLARVLQGCVMPVRWVETPVFTFDMICLNSLKERGTLQGFSWVLSSEIKAL